MGSMPVGDKLRVTERYKSKSENLPKVQKGTNLECCIASIVGGVFIAEYGSNIDTQVMGYGLIGISGLMAMWDIKRKYNPFRALFENLKLTVNEQVPRYINKRKTSYGYCLTFSLPYGLSTNDFEKKKLAIEQYLNKKIEISYNNYRIFIKVFEVGLEKSPKYQIPEVSKKVLEFPIGISYGGKLVVVDLENAVHLLVASETGGGKSTLLRGIITQLILSNKNVFLYLVDLKGGIEFSVFRKSKMVKKFARNIEDAEEVLSFLLSEVDRRYNLFYEKDVVDIKEYNKLKNIKKLDYKVLVIDEFADLQNEKGSISIIETLAAKARACGIHMIISTQRPDAKVLNGRIKANFPCTIGLKTKNGLNSRIIIDEEGLEDLRGFGHGLLSNRGIKEFQSFYITNEEARDLIKHTYEEKKKKVEKVEDIKDFGFLKVLEGGQK